MDKKLIGIGIVVFVCIAIVVYGVRTISPRIEQPSDELINADQSGEGKIP